MDRYWQVNNYYQTMRRITWGDGLALMLTVERYLIVSE